METSLELIVRSTEIDFLGHVNNAKYLEYMEWGREGWFRKADFNFEKMISTGIGTVSARIEINYHRELRLGDKMILKTWPEDRGRSSFVLKQELYKDNGQVLVSDARVTMVMINLKERKSVPIPEEILPHL